MEILVFINKVMVIMVILLTTITMVDIKITSKDLTALSFRLFRKDMELFLGSSKKPYWLNQLIKTCLYLIIIQMTLTVVAESNVPLNKQIHK